MPISSVPCFGDALAHQNLMVWLGLLAVAAVFVFVFKTALGLRLRAVGETRARPRPSASRSTGSATARSSPRAPWPPRAARSGRSASSSFTQNMSAGRGFIALAALIFGRWRPGGLLAATLCSASRARWPCGCRRSTSRRPRSCRLPCVLTLIAVAGVVGRSVPPAAGGMPYEKGE